MSDAEDIINKDPCAEYLRLANICVQTSNLEAGCGECFNTLTFREAFPRDITQQFRSAMGFVPQTNTAFCNVARERVCDNYSAKQSCCCQEETADFRACAFDKVLMPQVGWLEGVCTDNCEARLSEQASDDDGGGSVILIAALVAVILILLGAAGCILYRRMKTRNDYGLPTSVRIFNKKGDEGDETHIVNSSQSDEDINPDVEAPPPRTERKVSNFAERGDGDDDSSSSAWTGDSEPPPPITGERVLRESESEDDEETKPIKKSSKMDVLKEKRNAIEAWNTENKHYSQRSLSSFIPGEDFEGKNDAIVALSRSSSLSFIPDEDRQADWKDTPPRMPRSSSNRELSSSDALRSSSEIRKERKEMDTMIDQLKNTRKGLIERVNELKQHTTGGETNGGKSSRQMHSLMKDRAESTLRLSQLDDALKHYQHRVYALEAEAKALRKDRKSKETAKLSMSDPVLDNNIDNDLAGRRMKKERSDRRLRKSSSGNNLSARSEIDPSHKEKRVKKEGSSRNLPRQNNEEPNLVEKRERRKSGSNLPRQNSDHSLVKEKRERRESGSNLPRQNSDHSLVEEKREKGKSGSNLPRHNSEPSLVERRDRRRSGSSFRDLSRQGSPTNQASPKKERSTRKLARQQNSDPGSLGEKQERRKSGSSNRDLSRQGNSEASPKKTKERSSSRNLPTQNSDPSLVGGKRERRKSGASSRDFSRQGGEASPKKKDSSRSSD